MDDAAVQMCNSVFCVRLQFDRRRLLALLAHFKRSSVAFSDFHSILATFTWRLLHCSCLHSVLEVFFTGPISFVLYCSVRACVRAYLMINFIHQAVDKYNETNTGKSINTAVAKL